MKTPTHSVIIPMLNGARHVREAIASALAQLDADDEVLVIDNGSEDGSPEMVAAYPDARLRLLFEPKRGPAAARNRGIVHARGSFISFLDHDDLWPDGRQQGLLEALAETPGANAAHGRFLVRFDAPDSHRFAQINGRHAPTIGLHPYLFRRGLIEKAGLMDEGMMLGEDSDYLARLGSAGMIAAVYDGAAAVYRRHEGNMTLDIAAAGRGMLEMLARNIARRRASAKD